jgi:hypothetical protein
MAVDPCKWLHIVKDAPPSILDIDLKAVDYGMGGWVRIKRRVLTATTASGAYRELMNAYQRHACERLGSPDMLSAGGVRQNTTHLRDAKYLPSWVRERIAVLNVAPEDAPIRKVGIRWPATPDAPEDNTRWYTIELGCEELHDAA